MNLTATNVRIWKLFSIALIFLTILTSATTIYYHQELSSLLQEHSDLVVECEGKTILVTVRIDYDNGTITTFEEIELLYNSSVLKALMEVAKVEATWWPSFNAYFVDSINGIANNEDENGRYWEYWVNDEIGMISADQYTLADNDNLTWIYKK